MTIKKIASMVKKDFKYVYGPVPSRRLGHSLGIDLVPFKTCSYDCIYCQLGRTTKKTIDRKSFAPVEAIVAEIDRKLQMGLSVDYITLSGSGEPTLYSDLYTLVHRIKAKTSIPLAIITNGSLLWKPEVQEALLCADLVIPSLDAADARTFCYVNRPHPAISFEKVIEGLAKFRQAYSNELWLEIVLLWGITGIPAYVLKLNSLAKQIKPDRIQLNTVCRPPAENFAARVPEAEMLKFADLFEKSAEVISDFNQTHPSNCFFSSHEDVLNLLERRPCSLEDISMGLGILRNEAVKHLDKLLKKNIIATVVRKGTLYYKVKANGKALI